MNYRVTSNNDAQNVYRNIWLRFGCGRSPICSDIVPFISFWKKMLSKTFAQFRSTDSLCTYHRYRNKMTEWTLANVGLYFVFSFYCICDPIIVAANNCRSSQTSTAYTWIPTCGRIRKYSDRNASLTIAETLCEEKASFRLDSLISLAHFLVIWNNKFF